VHVQTEEFIWPDIVVLTYDPSRSTVISDTLKIDDKEVQAKLASLTVSKAKDRENLVLVVGRVEAGKLSIVRYDSGEIKGAGYGHLNAAPIALHYRKDDYHYISAGALKTPHENRND
jgi:hypothetical protein